MKILCAAAGLVLLACHAAAFAEAETACGQTLELPLRSRAVLAAHPFSLHAIKSMRLSVPGMHELTKRFGELAKANGGHYDGWSAAVVPKNPQIP
jgi:hypothetical protein